MLESIRNVGTQLKSSSFFSIASIYLGLFNLSDTPFLFCEATTSSSHRQERSSFIYSTFSAATSHIASTLDPQWRLGPPILMLAYLLCYTPTPQVRLIMAIPMRYWMARDHTSVERCQLSLTGAGKRELLRWESAGEAPCQSIVVVLLRYT